MYTCVCIMGFCTTIAVLGTVLYAFPTLPVQGNINHDSESCSTHQNGKIQEDHNLHCCGNAIYTISGSSCCNGVITQGLSQMVSDCCESKAFNPLNEICCNGQILILNNAQAECCGTEMYFDKTREGCCGDQLYNKNTHWCDNLEEPLTVKPIYKTAADFNHLKSEDSICPEAKKEICESTLVKVSDLKCGSLIYDRQSKICCSGVLFTRSPRYMCCGEHYYPLYDEKVLCCNGILHRNVPENSECVGGFIYTQNQIQLSCGLKVYNPHYKLRCCSGHLYNITQVDGKAECCGTHLLKERKNQTCCSSSSHVLLYETKLNHSCCGHYYYNRSLWSCCAGHLKPTPKKDNSTGGYSLKPLMDLIPDICNKTVVLGKVEGVALSMHQRLIRFRVFVEYSVKSGTVIKDCLYNTSLDHCSAPALEDGKIYLWEENGTAYIPLSLPVDLAFDIRMFFELCYIMAKMENNN